MTVPPSRRIQYVLGINGLMLLAIGCALVLWPFLSAILWAAVICFSTWPIYPDANEPLALPGGGGDDDAGTHCCGRTECPRRFYALSGETFG